MTTKVKGFTDNEKLLISSVIGYAIEAAEAGFKKHQMMGYLWERFVESQVLIDSLNPKQKKEVTISGSDNFDKCIELAVESSIRKSMSREPNKYTN